MVLVNGNANVTYASENISSNINLSKTLGSAMGKRRKIITIK